MSSSMDDTAARPSTTAATSEGHQQRPKRKAGSFLVLERLAAVIKQNRRVIFLSGAGLSCASGIPPFRGSNDAIWNNSVYEWGTKKKYLKNPLIWYREFFLKHFQEINTAIPNEGHIAIADIVKQYPNCKVITQNVDGLHSHPSKPIPSESLIEIHGRATSYKCYTEDCPYSTELSVELPRPVSSESEIPICPNCSVMCCPNTLLFDEDYSDHDLYQFEKALQWLDEADAIVFVGTSFAVGITNFAFEACKAREESAHHNPDVLELFNFNLAAAKLRTNLGTPMHFVQGRCEETLPKLRELLIAITQPASTDI